MNIVERFDLYRKEHIGRFKDLLNEVTKSILDMTKQISEEKIKKLFNTSERKALACSKARFRGKECEKDTIRVYFSTLNNGNYAIYKWNEEPAQMLDLFLNDFYPGISCMRTYKIDLYKRTMGFIFQFDTNQIGEDFENTLEVFNDDVAELLNSDFSINNWVDFKLEEGKKTAAINIKL